MAHEIVSSILQFTKRARQFQIVLCENVKVAVGSQMFVLGVHAICQYLQGSHVKNVVKYTSPEEILLILLVSWR